MHTWAQHGVDWTVFASDLSSLIPSVTVMYPLLSPLSPCRCSGGFCAVSLLFTGQNGLLIAGSFALAVAGAYGGAYFKVWGGRTAKYVQGFVKTLIMGISWDLVPWFHV